MNWYMILLITIGALFMAFIGFEVIPYAKEIWSQPNEGGDE